MKAFFFLFGFIQRKISLSGENIFSLATLSAIIYGQTKVDELITKIEWTNESTRNALSKVENLTILCIQFSGTHTSQTLAYFVNILECKQDGIIAN